MIQGLLLGLVVVAGAGGGIVLNEDNSHFYGSRKAEDMTVAGLQQFVDQYAGTKVSELFLCPNSMKTSYDSDVWDAIWELGDQRAPEEGFARAWVDNARLLSERGLDPYAVWIARCREKGISPWLSMRMNDVHNVDDPKSYIHGKFWVQHPDYWRVPGSTGSWVDRAFDYGIPEVREHHMALVRELLSRYDADGIELDWMRFGWHFKPGEEARGCDILTNFMRDVRTLTRDWAAKRAHPIKVAARVPTTPASARGLGMDGIRWAREGVVDMLVPSPFWATSDFDIPMDEWRKELGDSAGKVELAAGMEILLRAYPGGPAVEADLDAVRGFACAHLHRGADRIYLFNYMDPGPMAGGVQAYRQLLERGLAMDEVVKQPRRYVVTYRDTVPPGMSSGAVLPAKTKAGLRCKFYIGPVPSSGRAQLLLGLKPADPKSAEALQASIGGNNAAPGERCDDVLPGADGAVSYSWPAEALRAGYNEVHVFQDGELPEQEIVWAELRIQP